MKVFRLIWRAIQFENWARLGAAISTNKVTYVVGAVGMLVSLALSIALYGFFSDWGARYDLASEVKSGKKKFREYGAFSFFSEPDGAVFGNAISVYFENMPLVTIRLVAQGENLVLTWDYSYSLWKKIDVAEGETRRRGVQTLIWTADSFLGTPFVRNTTLEIPKGTLSPLLRSILEYAEARAEVQFDQAEMRAVIDIVGRFFLIESGLGSAYNSVLGSAFWSGDIQFLTLLSFILAMILMFVTIVSSRLADLSNFLLETLPYLGFLGTLIGMGQALQILGLANLSDGLQKAIGLGPIGSQMGLAIETTKFALVLYLAGGAVSHIVDVVALHIRRATGAEN